MLEQVIALGLVDPQGFFSGQGVECFDYSHNLNVICTGGVDHAVRLWNPYVTVKPVAIMKGHQSSIIDLAIHEALEQVFSYDKDGVKDSKNTGVFLLFELAACV